MQLDRTHIAIRARMLSEIGDLAMILIRNYPAAAIGGFVVGMLPWMIINALLIGWIPILQFNLGIFDDDMDAELWRYLLLMVTLVILQAPIAGALTTTLIGRSVFEDGVTWRSALKDLRSIFWRLFWILGVVRGPIPLMILIASNWGQDVAPIREVVIPILFLFAVGFQRGRRPFLPEILILERCPMRSRIAGVITAERRSAALHGPISGELFGRFMAVSAILAILAMAALQTMLSFRGVVLGQWESGPVVYLLFIPLALWFAAALSTLIRFLSYLDTRIRLEGWEVDLAIRAESLRQFGSDVSAPVSPQPTPKSRFPDRTNQVLVALLAVLLPVAIGGCGPSSTSNAGNESPDMSPAAQSNADQVMPVTAGKSDVVLQKPPATPWYDPKQDSLVPVEVRTVLPESANRDSRWLPKPPKATPSASGPSTSSGLGSPSGGVSIMNLIGWLLLIIIGFGLVFLILFLFNKVEPDAISGRKSATSGPLIDIDEQMIQRMKELPAEVRRTDVNLRTEAERLMNLSRFDEAIVMLFGHQLLLLDRCRVLRLARGKTNGRYVRETRVNAPEANRFFVNTVNAFEASYFGGHTPTADRFERLWQDNATLESVVRPRWETSAS